MAVLTMACGTIASELNPATAMNPNANHGTTPRHDGAEAEVDAADEILITSATREVVAGTQLNGKPIGKGDYLGKPGPVYHKFFAAYQEVKKRLCG